jgi:hypothetical protein
MEDIKAPKILNDDWVVILLFLVDMKGYFNS